MVGAPLFWFLILVDALGDCVPDTDCRKGFLRYVALPTLVVILIVGFGVRAAINRFRRTTANRPERSGASPPWKSVR